MRTLARPIAVLALVVALAGCGDDGGGSAAEDYCDRLSEAKELLERSDFPVAEAARALRELEALAPDEIADDISTIRSAIEGVTELNEDDPQSYARLVTPEVLAASERWQDFNSDECGEDVTLLGS